MMAASLQACHPCHLPSAICHRYFRSVQTRGVDINIFCSPTVPEPSSKLLYSVLRNLWRDGVGGGVPLATGGPFECRQQRSTMFVALRAGDGLALAPSLSVVTGTVCT
jgi:hypothetical protein